jgi:hypothetical protein
MENVLLWVIIGVLALGALLFIGRRVGDFMDADYRKPIREVLRPGWPVARCDLKRLIGLLDKNAMFYVLCRYQNKYFQFGITGDLSLARFVPEGTATTQSGEQYTDGYWEDVGDKKWFVSSDSVGLGGDTVLTNPLNAEHKEGHFKESERVEDVVGAKILDDKSLTEVWPETVIVAGAMDFDAIQSIDNFKDFWNIMTSEKEEK